MEVEEALECECGCDGSCECATESEYQLEPAQIDTLIQWMTEYTHERLQKGNRREYEDQLELAFEMLSELFFHGKLSEGQRARFEEACFCASEIGWPWDDVIEAYIGGENGG